MYLQVFQPGMALIFRAAQIHAIAVIFLDMSTYQITNQSTHKLIVKSHTVLMRRNKNKSQSKLVVSMMDG